MAYKVYMGKLVSVTNPKAKFTSRQNRFAAGLKTGVEKFMTVK